MKKLEKTIMESVAEYEQRNLHKDYIITMGKKTMWVVALIVCGVALYSIGNKAQLWDMMLFVYSDLERATLYGASLLKELWIDAEGYIAVIILLLVGARIFVVKRRIQQKIVTEKERALERLGRSARS